MESDDDFDISSSDPNIPCTEFTPFTPHLALRDSKSLTTLSLLSSLLTTVDKFGIPHLFVNGDIATKIGEGATYIVEKSSLQTRLPIPIAKKSTKFTVPKPGAQAYVEDPSLRRRIKSVLLELQILSHPPLKGHPNIVRLLGYSWEEIPTGYSPAVIVELAEFGSLDEFAASGLSWAEKKVLCDDIVVGLDALHSCGIAHGDMKPDNILVFKHHQRRFIAKLSDFEHALLGVDLVRYGGTPIYSAPEVHLQDHPSQKLLIPLKNFPLCDAFSFGLSVFEIFCDGKRYYQNENTRSFRNLLMDFDHAKDEILSLALEFLETMKEFHPEILRVCRNIFRETLCFCPTDRLKGGWSHIRELIGAETFLFSTKKSDEPSPQRFKNHQQIDYSILSFFACISTSSESIPSEISAELRHRTRQSMLPPEDRGKAAFQLCFCSAAGFGQEVNPQESANWLSQSALLGYEPALIIGARVMNANDLPIPDVFSQGSLTEEIRSLIKSLENLAPEDYYPNAVRVFWGRELRNLAQTTLDVEGDVICVLETNRFLEWFDTKRTCHGPAALCDFIDRNFLLHYSAAVGNTQISKLLIENGGSIDLVNSDGQTPLYLACRGVHSTVARMLLSNKADPSIGDLNGVTPLHWIILFPEIELYGMGKFLVSKGADPNVQMAKNSELYFDCLGLILRGSPFHWACFCHNQSAVKLLLSLGANPTLYIPHPSTRPGIASPLVYTLATLGANIAETLISTSRVLVSLSEDKRAMLYPEIGSGSGYDFQRWIIHGKRIRQAYMLCIDLLLQNEIPLNGYPDPPKCPVTKLTLWLKGLKPGAEANEAPHRHIPIHGAALRRNVNLVKAMIARGARVSIRDPKGYTALHNVMWASFDKFQHSKVLKIAEILLRDDATLEEDLGTGPWRLAPSFLTTACRHDVPLELIRTILSRGAHTTVNSLAKGETPLHLCHEDPNVIDLLQEFGADINLESKHITSRESGYLQHDIRPVYCCMTAAGKALSGVNWEYLQKLLNKGITLTQGSTGGHQHTLLHLAVQRYYSRIAGRDYNPSIMETCARFFEKILDHPVIQEGKLVNIPDWAGFTPLKYAIWFAMPKCTATLLSRGALVDDTLSKTPRMVADEFYLDLPHFVEDDDIPTTERVVINNSEATVFEWPKQYKSEYRTRLKEIISILDNHAQKSSEPFTHLPTVEPVLDPSPRAASPPHFHFSSSSASNTASNEGRQMNSSLEI